MSTYEFFKDFAAPIATGAAAVSAAFVTGVFAYRQAKAAELQAAVALDRLKYDTFAKRHDVLVACRDSLTIFRDNIPHTRIRHEDFNELVSRAAAGTFYFCSDVSDIIASYVHDAVMIMTEHLNILELPSESPERLELEKDIVGRVETFSDNIVVVNRVLQYDLSLNFLKQGSKREFDQRRELGGRFSAEASSTSDQTSTVSA